MQEVEKLRVIINDLVELLHLQAKELEQLTTHVEQNTTHLPHPHQFSVVASGLNALHKRIQKLSPQPPETA